MILYLHFDFRLDGSSFSIEYVAGDQRDIRMVPTSILSRFLNTSLFRDYTTDYVHSKIVK